MNHHGPQHRIAGIQHICATAMSARNLDWRFPATKSCMDLDLDRHQTRHNPDESDRLDGRSWSKSVTSRLFMGVHVRVKVAEDQRRGWNSIANLNRVACMHAQGEVASDHSSQVISMSKLESSGVFMYC
jgi:hypothetical protein